jgi:hypothetical protein
MQSFAEQQRNEINNSNELYKIAFLSYYISLYVSNIEAKDISKRDL